MSFARAFFDIEPSSSIQPEPQTITMPSHTSSTSGSAKSNGAKTTTHTTVADAASTRDSSSMYEYDPKAEKTTRSQEEIRKEVERCMKLAQQNTFRFQ